MAVGERDGSFRLDLINIDDNNKVIWNSMSKGGEGMGCKKSAKLYFPTTSSHPFESMQCFIFSLMETIGTVGLEMASDIFILTSEDMACSSSQVHSI